MTTPTNPLITEARRLSAFAYTTTHAHGFANMGLIECDKCALEAEYLQEFKNFAANNLLAFADKIEELQAVISESNEVCMCGCPADQHENYGEDGEGCGIDSHECVRTCIAVRQNIEELEREIAELQLDVTSSICACSIKEVEPCSRRCTCRWPHYSGGCRRCATYGSDEQRIGVAKHIVEQEQQIAALQAQVEELKAQNTAKPPCDPK